ncbi:MAG TPA: 3-deoxy-7-phosphoheptulonate synthase [Solirubrobacteraceae bacterium]|jgi:3-deoxy-7-phosphoheptulonate synthase|nr:3-deoxy-7-phosphoheptulonate synthase [Solirubrobacteraceae bacterium]
MTSTPIEPGAAGSGGADAPRAGGVRDQRIERVVPLTAPEVLLDELPLTAEHEELVLQRRNDVHAILNGIDDRLLVIVGPCSVHDVDATLDYAGRLRALADALSDDLVIAMRMYFEKPRTTTGWKGLINDPHIDGSGDVNAGLRTARRVLLDVLDTGLCVGCEFLDPITPQYISDAVSWGAIGARTTESQIHRQLASGLSMPVGFKNRTDGNVAVAVDAVRAAAVSHAFAGIDADGAPAVLYTRGNPDCHVILRGGRGAPNYDALSVADALARLRAVGLTERVVVDASHDNSDKDPERQRDVVADLAAQIAAGNAALTGLMLESFIVGGKQEPDIRSRLTYGQSITDACMSWDTTADALEEIAAAVRERRDAA